MLLAILDEVTDKVNDKDAPEISNLSHLMGEEEWWPVWKRVISGWLALASCPSPLANPLRILVFELDFLDFHEGNHDLFGGMAFLHLQMEIVGGNAADALADELPAR